ncbi:cell division septal protein FtsQ [Deinococcus metallilatus]|uniref:Cell division septal protein FtsQ n=1 Tax=Deinococcus metallilatus TaxID=1211322 RepID=A0ABR6MW06_9DEIO|nr:cell division septal protein FtsQ [Deinococcus metallilatus]GMA13974.1 hypothetical protein GCM10025871_03050 [Deinococcus metallilatus]
MLLVHKKRTKNRKARQAKFRRSVKLLAAWTGFVTALVALVTALAELIHTLGKLLP